MTDQVTTEVAAPRKLLDLPVRVQAAMKALNKTYGENAIIQLGTIPESVNVTGVISTGSFSLDLALGLVKHQPDGSVRLGLPRGRTVEVYGPEASGKTTLCNHVIANAQKEGGLCAFIDMEHAWDKDYAEAVGVDVDNLLISQPSYAEQALETVKVMVQSMDVSVVVVDSVASLVPKSELEGEIGDASVGTQSRLMSQTMRMLTPIINQSNCLVMFTNQLREKIGVMFGSPETTPGGRALKFYSSVRLDMRKEAQLKDGEGEVGGHTARVKVVKNKVGPSYRTAEFDLLYGKGIDIYSDVYALAVKKGVLTAKGSWIYHGEDRVGQGKNQTCSILQSDPEFLAKLKNEIIFKVLGGANGQEMEQQ